MSQEARERAEAMARRVVLTARRVGAPREDLPLLERAHALAMAPRLALPLDGHDPDFLHPARSALILMLDTAEADPAVLAAAMLTETQRVDLRPPMHAIEERIGGDGSGAAGKRAVGLVAEVPLPEAEDLVERLVLAERGVQLVALAERLDHLRHAHLWRDAARMRVTRILAEEVYGPLAHRVHPRLAHRYDRSLLALARRRRR